MTKLKTIRKDGRTYLVPVNSTEPHAIQFEKVVRECGNLFMSKIYADVCKECE